LLSARSVYQFSSGGVLPVDVLAFGFVGFILVAAVPFFYTVLNASCFLPLPLVF
jgi:hypothetical protein